MYHDAWPTSSIVAPRYQWSVKNKSVMRSVPDSLSFLKGGHPDYHHYDAIGREGVGVMVKFSINLEPS